MNKVLIASNNSNKIFEIKNILGENQLISLKDFGVSIDVTEDGNTLEDNAFKKAKEFSKVLNLPALSDDTGLFVDALDGAPGIYSARYAGENVSYKDNCNKLLANLKKTEPGKKNAVFVCVICFYVNEKEFYFFKGECKGKIIAEARGVNGFGYDPLFVPDGYNKSFAELTDEEKNKISHRAVSLNKFKEFSDSYFQ